MTETSSSPVPRRDFDWGPPAGPIPERGTDWGVYLFFVLLVAGGAWLLVDSARQGDFAAAPEGSATAVSRPVSGKKPDARPLTAPSPETGTIVDSAPGTGNQGQGVPETPAAAIPPTKQPSFHVQLGAFGDGEMARATFEQLKKKGFTAQLLSPDDSFEMYRVTMGPYTDENDANRIARQLNELEFPCFVIESP